MTNQTRSSDLIRLSVQDDGRLCMTLLLVDPDDKSDFEEQYNEFGEIDTLARLLEPFSTNGSFAFIDGSTGNPALGLTSAPFIAEALSYDEQGQAQVDGRLWWFPNYAGEGVIDTLLEQGQVHWTCAPNPEPQVHRARKP